MAKKKEKVLTPEQQEEIRTKDFFDCILPGTIKFHTDYYIIGDSFRSVWALKGIIYTEHPDTHVKLQGYTIPYVKEAVEMVLKAATITPQIRYVDWDIATTPTGPAIIEGNTYCAHDFWQLPPHTPDGIGMLPKIKEYIPEFFEGKIK